jgi:hypothetical protein
MKTNTLTSASALLKSLTVAEIESRLHELTAEAKALRTILRSLKARERERAKAAARLISQSNGKLMRGDDPRLTKREDSRHA